MEIAISSRPRPAASRLRRLSADLTPPKLLALGFAAVILAGALLLTLPLASASDEPTGFLTALFTATSAVCVTGLVVVDTGTYYSPFGQLLILSLIQIGGLGFMSVATLFFLLIGRRIGLSNRILIREAFNQIDAAGVVRLVRNVFVFTALAEGCFALLLAWRWAGEVGAARALWLGLFHSVSAFNNAGFQDSRP